MTITLCAREQTFRTGTFHVSKKFHSIVELYRPCFKIFSVRKHYNFLSANIFKSIFIKGTNDNSRANL